MVEAAEECPTRLQTNRVAAHAGLNAACSADFFSVCSRKMKCQSQRIGRSKALISLRFLAVSGRDFAKAGIKVSPENPVLKPILGGISHAPPRTWTFRVRVKIK